MKTLWTRSFRISGPSTTTLALGLLLATYADENGVGVRVSTMTLATMLGVSARTTSKHLDALREGGWIAVAMIDGTDSIRLAMPKR